jgi:hypothetical protein
MPETNPSKATEEGTYSDDHQRKASSQDPRAEILHWDMPFGNPPWIRILWFNIDVLASRQKHKHKHPAMVQGPIHIRTTLNALESRQR